MATAGPVTRSFELLCPGPVNVHPEVARALTSVEFGHREQEICVLLDSLRSKLLAVAGVGPNHYDAVVLTGSGTAANEAVLSTAVDDGEAVLVLANGEFGERLAEISRVHNPHTEILRHGWGEALSLERVEAALAGGRFSLVVMVHHETSTGLINPVEQVGKLAKAHGARLFVDAVSSYSADPLDLEAAGVSFLTSSSGKAIGSYPGLSFVIGLHEAFRGLPSRAAHCQYLDLRRYYAFMQEQRQTPNTPALPLLLALDRALDLALEEGIGGRHRRLASLAEHVRRHVRALGLQTLFDDGAQLSNVLTSVLLPEGVTFEPFRQALRERGFVVYGGKGEFSDRMFQVATIGAVDEALLDRFFGVVGEIFAQLGVPRLVPPPWREAVSAGLRPAW